MFWTGYHALLVGSDVFEDQRRQSMGPLLKYEAVHDEHIDYVPTDSDADSVPPRSDDDSPPAPSETDGEIEPERQYQDNIRLTEASTSADAARATDDDIPTSVRPRYLCFAKDFEAGTYETVRVSDYIKQNGDDVDLEFVFVSYTRMQFRVATDDEISNATYPDEATREANRELARQDRELLVRWGMDAARKVGKRAFWLDFECVRDNESMAGSTSSSDDVYHICDIVRAAHSMIIAIGPPASDKVASIREGQEPPPYSREYVTPWLRQWGSRLWTLPELLLCPGEYRIRLYVAGDPSEPKAMAKRNFAERAWDDAGAVKELVNHFEGSAILTSQALIEAAFECFSRRQTEQLTQGDIAYAIMGLFPSRYRPRVDKSHSGFQAFARLALANDSGALLERLICLAPRPGAPWYQTEDCWGVQLSDMHSYIKVDKVLGSDTVLLNGVWAAAIQWDDMRPETAIDGESSKLIKIYLLSASAMSLVVPAMCGYLFPSIALIVDSSTPPDSLPVLVLSAFIGFLLSLMALMAVLAPVALNRSRAQPKQPIKARLIGIEGTVDAGTAEKLLWGHAHGNLVDTTPCSYSDAGESSSREPPSPPEKEDFAFTLVDTYSMTVMHCRCSMPPTAMMIFGRESGMKRTILCSYDWRTQTYHRQAVLRLDRQGLDRMHKVDDVRFSLGPHPERQQLASCMLSPAAAQMPKLGWNSWKRELLFLAMCFVRPFSCCLIVAKTNADFDCTVCQLFGGPLSWLPAPSPVRAHLPWRLQDGLSTTGGRTAVPAATQLHVSSGHCGKT